MAVDQPMNELTETLPSGASPLPQLNCERHEIPVGSKAAALLLLIWGRPVKHAGRSEGMPSLGEVPSVGACTGQPHGLQKSAFT